jgi:drug/metabolite transporter (DMT)-like permease
MTNKNFSFLLGLITIICWSSIATFGSLLIHLPPFYVLGMSFLFGSLPGLLRPKEMFPSIKVSLWGIFGYFAYHFFLFYSFRFAPALESNLINYLWPVIMVFLTPVFFKQEKLKWFNWLGAFLSIMGSLFLVFGLDGAFHLSSLKGHLLALAAAFIWPIYSLGKKKMSPTSVWAVSGFCFGSALLCFLMHSWLEPRVVLQFSDALKLMIMGLGPFGLAFYFWDIAMRRGDPRILAGLAYLTPVLSTTNLVVFGHEQISNSTALAMLLIIGGACSGLLDFLTPKR